jgi:hypothetical protein
VVSHTRKERKLRQKCKNYKNLKKSVRDKQESAKSLSVDSKKCSGKQLKKEPARVRALNIWDLSHHMVGLHSTGIKGRNSMEQLDHPWQELMKVHLVPFKRFKENMRRIWMMRRKKLRHIIN